jgi:hypothetical protein
MDIQKYSFSDFKCLINNNDNDAKEGIVLFGTGGDLNEWVSGVFNQLKEESIITASTVEELFSNVIELKTTGGRTDLALIFNNFENINMGKMAMWRLQFGDCSWISDYIPNYSNQHEFNVFEEDITDNTDEDDEE